MSDGSPIEWLQRPGTKPATWNPIRAIDKASGKRGWFCVHVHEGCRFCYAERLNTKAGDTGGNGHAYIAQNLDKVDIVLHEPTLLQPLKWRSPRTIFVCSMSDLYGDWVKDEWLNKIKAVQALTPQHTYIELTKRPERMRSYLTTQYRHDQVGDVMMYLADIQPGFKCVEWPFRNVWGLVSCSGQEDADRFVPILLATPLAIRGVSYEPALGPCDLRPWLSENDGCESCDDGVMGAANRCSRTDIPRAEQCPRNFAVVNCHDVPPYGAGGCPTWVQCDRVTLDWVITGGESGREARPADPQWFRDIHNQCAAAGVAHFHKQHGEWTCYDQVGADEWQFTRDSDGKRFGTILRDGLKIFSGEFETRYPFNGPEGKQIGPCMVRVGKKAAGRLLDGREHSEFPVTDGSQVQPALASHDPNQTEAVRT